MPQNTHLDYQHLINIFETFLSELLLNSKMTGLKMVIIAQMIALMRAYVCVAVCMRVCLMPLLLNDPTLNGTFSA